MTNRETWVEVLLNTGSLQKVIPIIRLKLDNLSDNYYTCFIF